MVKFENIVKEAEATVASAIKDFIQKNNISENKIEITVLNPTNKVLIRNYDDSVPTLKIADNTIYHGQSFDIFTFSCITRTSGMLEFSDCLTNSYRNKCS